MRISEALGQAFHHMQTQKVRIGLSLIGVIIGCMAVVTLLYALTLFKFATLGEYEKLGATMIRVHLNQDNKQPTCSQLDSALKLITSVPTVDFAYPTMTTSLKVGKTFSLVIGLNAKLLQFLNSDTYQGRLLTDLDDKIHHAVIGHKLNGNLFKNGDQLELGSQLQLDDSTIKIVGFLKPISNLFFLNVNPNDAIVIPISTMCESFPNSFIEILVKTTSTATVDATVKRIKTLFAYFEKNRIAITAPRAVIDAMESTMKFVGWLGAITAIVCLLVGGIGIMNIQIANTMERQKEIAIRMCFGATRRDIMTMFFIETIVICFLGGLVGTLFGLIATYVICMYTQWLWVWTVIPILYGLSLAIITGCVFGLYPAYLACKHHPATVLKEYS